MTVAARKITYREFREMEFDDDDPYLYEKFGIPEYWLVDPNNQSIEIYTLQNNRYELLVFADATESVASKVIAKLEITAADLFND